MVFKHRNEQIYLLDVVSFCLLSCNNLINLHTKNHRPIAHTLTSIHTYRKFTIKIHSIIQQQGPPAVVDPTKPKQVVGLCFYYNFFFGSFVRFSFTLIYMIWKLLLGKKT